MLCSTLSLYSQAFDRELSVVRRTSLSMVGQWWQLSTLPNKTLPNKVKQFVLMMRSSFNTNYGVSTEPR